MPIDVSNTPDMYEIDANGTFTFNTKVGVRNDLRISIPKIALLTVKFLNPVRLGQITELTRVKMQAQQMCSKLSPAVVVATRNGLFLQQKSITPLQGDTCGANCQTDVATHFTFGRLTSDLYKVESPQLVKAR